MATMRPANLLFICSDEHNRDMLGCAGHPVVQTPHLDRLAAAGVRFTSAYCNSPICVPSRASLATGRYAHQIGAWDNAAPYTGTPPSWGHRLTAAGHAVTTIGKLHYRRVEDDTGFPDQRLPMHIKDGVGDVYSLVRDNLARRPGAEQRVREAGPGESAYARFDRAIADAACQWLRAAPGRPSRPWVLFVGFVTPHLPLIAPPEFFDRYPLDRVVFPRRHGPEERPHHPVLDARRRIYAMDDAYEDAVVRRAVAAYYGLCSFVDHQIGAVLRTLREAGLAETTRIIYTSDHGDMVGEHGLWWKSTMYEGAAAVPFIIAGPDLPRNQVVDTPISLVDCFPTILDAVGATPAPEDRTLPGTSLWPIARGETAPERAIFSEYHAAGARQAFYMVRFGHYKYVHYVGERPQLFDLRADPGETEDLALRPAFAPVLREGEAALRRVCDPDEVDRRARADQARVIAQHGGREAILAGARQIPFTPAPAAFQTDHT